MDITVPVRGKGDSRFGDYSRSLTSHSDTTPSGHLWGLGFRVKASFVRYPLRIVIVTLSEGVESNTHLCIIVQAVRV